MNERHATTRSVLATCITLMAAGNALANMPMLTDQPRPPSPMACKEWATKQGDEALVMWGIQEDGKSSRAVGLNRLASYCMGQPKPEIVGFGSSAGFDRDYCSKHQEQDLCIARQRPESPTRESSKAILGCFVRNYDKDHLARHPDQTITSVKFKVYPSPSEVDTIWYAIRMQRRGELKALYSGGVCKDENSETKCYVECDGGGVRFIARPNSAILMRLGVNKGDERISMAACGARDVENGSPGIEVTGGKDDREFLLRRVDDRQCVGIER